MGLSAEHAIAARNRKYNMRIVGGRRAREAVETSRAGVIVWIAVVAIAGARTAWTPQVSGPTGRFRGVDGVASRSRGRPNTTARSSVRSTVARCE